MLFICFKANQSPPNFRWHKLLEILPNILLRKKCKKEGNSIRRFVKARWRKQEEFSGPCIFCCMTVVRWHLKANSLLLFFVCTVITFSRVIQRVLYLHFENVKGLQWSVSCTKWDRVHSGEMRQVLLLWSLMTSSSILKGISWGSIHQNEYKL